MEFTQTGPTVQMHGWYLQEERRRAVTWTWAFPGTRRLKEPEERKGPGWALFRGHIAAALSPSHLPSTPHPPLVPGEGSLGVCSWLGRCRKGEGEKGPSLVAVQDYWIIHHPPMHP